MAMLPVVQIHDDLYPTRPSRIINQQFGMGLNFDDMMSPMFTNEFFRPPSAYYRAWQAASANRDSGSTVLADQDKFQVNLDVQHFNPSEVIVKVVDENTVTIEGKHEEKADEHGTIYRHFVRKYRVPEGHDMNKITSKLSSDGVLSISAPRQDKAVNDHKVIPIQQTGVPSKPMENNKRETEENVVEK